MVGPIITVDDIVLFRAQARAEMPDTCKITIPGEVPEDHEMDEETLQYPDIPRTVIYGPGAVDGDGDHLLGICRFQIKSDINSNIIETQAGEREWTYSTSQLQIPVTELHIPIDAVVECLTSPFNPNLVGRVFNIQGEIQPKSKPVIRRIRLREPVA